MITSPLAIKEHSFIKRKDVDFVYDTLLNFFGERYFDLDKIKYLQNQKLILSANSLFQLLGIHSDNCFYSLLEIATLLEYSKKLSIEVYQKLKSLREDFSGLRNYLFEIFVYRLFYGNNIPIQIKPVVRGQELEASFMFKGEPGIIECKKLYSSEINRYSHLQSCFNFFYKKWFHYQPNIFAFIIAPSKKLDDLSREKEIIKESTISYFDKVKQEGKDDFEFKKNNENDELILHIGKNSPGFFENYRHLYTKNPHAFFSATPPPIVRPKDYNFFHFLTGYHFSYLETDVQEKIIREIKKKRKQHKEHKDLYRFFFFENEATSTGEFPLITDKILKSDLIMSYLNSKKDKDVICIIDKNFLPNQLPNAKMHVYCREEFQDLRTYLESLDLNLFSA